MASQGCVLALVIAYLLILNADHMLQRSQDRIDADG